ncbi:MAG: sigma-70 family RNA polymerase sigma factor [Bacteroidaceae bacterium]|nr:sigma-70 family RNA polymerase sigma factor [Bacteroidaceae bacterium]MDD7376581.1 sigma-70 family RNA polymerase sigma factor [Prevotellaceae bacterium]
MDYKQKRFEQMVNQNKGTIYTVCYMFSKDSDEVADLFQETLINLWKGMPEKDEISNIKGWIYRVSLNTCISLNRKKKSRPTVPLTMDIDLFESKGEKEQQVEMLHKRITRLQPFDRAIVLLWLEDISYEEIGLILGITAKNVSVRLTRIREKLKQMSNE